MRKIQQTNDEKQIEKIKLNFILPIHYYTQYQLNLVKLQIKSKGKSKIKENTHTRTHSGKKLESMMRAGLQIKIDNKLREQLFIGLTHNILRHHSKTLSHKN